MIEYRRAGAEDIEALMRSRMDTLRAVNGLGTGYAFSSELVAESRRFFLEGDQTTVLAMDGERAVGCATLCYTAMMPTLSHPTGKRAHLMNVYTDASCRGQGVASRMLSILIGEAKERCITEISLDATEAGRPLYRKFGFADSAECMVLELKSNRKDE